MKSYKAKKVQNTEGCFLFNLNMHNYIYITDRVFFYVNECDDVSFKCHLFLSFFFFGYILLQIHLYMCI